VRLMLEGHADELEKSLEQRMQIAAANEQFELAGRYRDLVITLHQLQEKQRIAAASDDDADVFGFHYEKGMLAANLFHIRNGRIVDRREFFWEDLPEFPEAQVSNGTEREADLSDVELLAEASEAPTHGEAEYSSSAETFAPAVFFSALLKQLYIDQQYVPRNVYVPVDFADRAALAELLCEHTGHKVEIAVPQRGEKRSLLDLAGQNAKQSYDQRFRVLQPSIRVIQESLQDALNLPAPPERIECFDISHIQGAETVASMVVWEKGAMNKSEYRKFQVKSVEGVDDFASMREVVTRRYRRLQEEHRPMPNLILIDGGLGQLHDAAAALEELSFTSQPIAAIAKREEVIYVYGQEDDPVVLDRHSPVLHLVQRIRDESHRFAITYHRKRREMRDRDSDLLRIPGVGALTRNRLITHFGSLRAIQSASLEALQSVVSRKVAEAICAHFQNSIASPKSSE
jgi:excinuclease ABC subunit C